MYKDYNLKNHIFAIINHINKLSMNKLFIRRAFLIGIIIVLSTICLDAQTNSRNIMGKVVDEQNQPIEFANVAIYSLPDSTLRAGTATNNNGEFILPFNGTLINEYLQISFIGYKTKIAPATAEQVIILKDDNSLLDEVVVKGNRKIYKIDNGNIVANVKNTVLETLPSANEVIAQLPFLSETDGDFMVFGKGTPIIYINNRLLRNNKELEQLSPSDIKTIRVITTPGAQYDATVKAVIKITTEKPVGEGLSGMLRTQGKQNSVFSANEYVSLNYRTGAWDVFGSTYYIQNRYKTDFNAIQELLLANNKQRLVYHTFENGGYNDIIPALGLNYNPNSNHSTGLQYTYDNTIWKSNGENFIDNMDERVNQLSNFRQSENNHKVNAYYNGNITEKLSLNINFDWVKGDEEETMDAYYAGTPNDILKTQSTRDYDLYAGKGIFSYTLGSGIFEFGGEYTYTRFLQTYGINNPELGIDNSNDKAIQDRRGLFLSYLT